eukprot:XP_011672689.1 PREDICTED: uncharacterized protein LOC105442353 [Strongylocentrotus purpuratus]
MSRLARLLAGAGIDSTSPYYNIIQDGAGIGSQAVGYDDREDLCQHLEQALSVQGDNNAARRTFSMDIISEIFASMEEADRCTPLANDVIRQVIQPLIRMDLPAYVLSNEEILAYTGIDGGVTAVCTAMENAVTCLNAQRIGSMMSEARRQESTDGTACCGGTMRQKLRAIDILGKVDAFVIIAGRVVEDEEYKQFRDKNMLRRCTNYKKSSSPKKSVDLPDRVCKPQNAMHSVTGGVHRFQSRQGRDGPYIQGAGVEESGRCARCTNSRAEEERTVSVSP